MLKPCCHCRERRCCRAISPDLLEPIHHLEEGALPPPPPPEWLLKPEHRWTPPPAVVKDWSSCTVVASFPPSVSSVISLQNEFLSTSRACRKKPHCFSCLCHELELFQYSAMASPHPCSHWRHRIEEDTPRLSIARQWPRSKGPIPFRLIYSRS
jgi:hypothetical protein